MKAQTNGEAHRITWWLMGVLLALVIGFGTIIYNQTASRIDAVEAQQKEIVQYHADAATRLVLLESNQINLNKRLDQIEQRLDRIETKLDSLSSGGQK